MIAMTPYKKRNFALAKINRYLEPGPVLLVSSAWKGERNIMTMSWLTVMEFTPALVGCIISNRNHSFELIRKSKACVINLPTAELADEVVGIGNCSGRDLDKFAQFKLTALPAKEVAAPLIRECYANFECKLVDTSLITKYNFFIFEVVKALVATGPELPRTLHYRGEGKFMLSGREINLAKKFRHEMLM